MSSAARVKAQNYIDENSVVIFSKSWCGYCRSSKKLLTDMGAKFQTVELDQMADGRDMQDALEEMTGQETVPNIYINKQHIGGSSELRAKQSQLKQLLEEAGAL